MKSNTWYPNNGFNGVDMGIRFRVNSAGCPMSASRRLTLLIAEELPEITVSRLGP